MKYDLTGNVVIECRLVRSIDAMNLAFLRLPAGSVEQLDIGVKLCVLIEALEAVNAANDCVERVNMVVEGIPHHG